MKKSRIDIVVVGELNIDLVLWNVPMPEDEKEKLAEDMRFTMGSSSAITAHNLSAIGTNVGFLGKVGKDSFGDFMITQLAAGGVDTSHIIRDGNVKTGATIILANPPKKALLTYMGAMTTFTIDEIDWDYIRQARHLHLGCFFLQTGIRKDVWKLFAEAKKLGLTTSMDTNWDPDEEWGEDLKKALEFTDIFFPNEDEALRIAGASTAENAMEKLEKIVPILCMKRGIQGSLLSVNGKRYSQPIFKVEAVETTGAGDSFNAGFLHKYLKEEKWEECLIYGNLCGALAVTQMGGTGAFSEKESLRERMESVQGNG